MKAALAAAVLALTACSGGPDAAACKAVIKQRFDYALTHPDAKPNDTLPPACKGLDAATMQRITTEILYGK